MSGSLGAIDRDAALQLAADAEGAIIAAAASDRSHRWAGDAGDDGMLGPSSGAMPAPEVPA